MDTQKKAFSAPRWQQLPAIGLYMDQVLLVLGEYLQPLAVEDGPMVTPTMINNYVKMKLTPPPEKKKYNRAHLARFFMICLLKKVLSMPQIALLMESMEAEHSPEEAYDLFCGELEQRLMAPDGPAGEDCPPLLNFALRAVVSKIWFEKLLQKPQ